MKKKILVRCANLSLHGLVTAVIPEQFPDILANVLGIVQLLRLFHPRHHTGKARLGHHISVLARGGEKLEKTVARQRIPQILPEPLHCDVKRA